MLHGRGRVEWSVETVDLDVSEDEVDCTDQENEVFCPVSVPDVTFLWSDGRGREQNRAARPTERRKLHQNTLTLIGPEIYFPAVIKPPAAFLSLLNPFGVEFMCVLCYVLFLLRCVYYIRVYDRSGFISRVAEVEKASRLTALFSAPAVRLVLH